MASPGCPADRDPGRARPEWQASRRQTGGHGKPKTPVSGQPAPKPQPVAQPSPAPAAPAKPKPPRLPDNPALLRAWALAGKQVDVTLRRGEVLHGRLLEVAKYALLVRDEGARAPTLVMKHAVDTVRATD